MKSLLAALLLLAASPALADAEKDPAFDPVFVRQTNHCRYAGADFDLVSAGLTRELDDEENAFGAKTLWIRAGSRKPELAMRDTELKYGEFMVRRVGGSGGTESAICYGMPAFALSPSVVALIFIHDARPGGVELGAIFYDAKENRILKSMKSIDTIDEQVSEPLLDTYRAKISGISSAVPAFWFATRQNRSGANRGQTVIHGKKLYFWDQDLGLVRKVSWEGGSPKIETDPDATTARSRWTRYFESREAMKAAAGWDERSRKFAHEVIWVASPRDMDEGVGECVQFAKSRKDLKPKGWICGKKSP